MGPTQLRDALLPETVPDCTANPPYTTNRIRHLLISHLTGTKTARYQELVRHSATCAQCRMQMAAQAPTIQSYREKDTGRLPEKENELQQSKSNGAGLAIAMFAIIGVVVLGFIAILIAIGNTP